MTQRVLVFVALVLVLVPVAALAGADEARNAAASANGMIQDNQEGGIRRSHTNIEARPSMGKIWDPNKKGLTPQQMKDLYTGLELLLTSLADSDKTAADRAWAQIPSVLRDALNDMSIDQSNWKQRIRLVNILPRRIDGLLAVDKIHGGEGQTVYETQNRPFTEKYVEEEEIWGPIGCGCRGKQVVGTREVTKSRVVYRPVTVAVAAKVPVVKTSAILTPFDGVKTYTVPRTVTYQEPYEVEVRAPIGCGCRGSVVVGTRTEYRTAYRTEYDQVSEKYTTFEPHLTQNFTALGNNSKDDEANAFLPQGSYSQDPNNPNMVIQKTDDNGNILNPSIDAKEKAKELAKTGATGASHGADAAQDASFGTPITREKNR